MKMARVVAMHRGKKFVPARDPLVRELIEAREADGLREVRAWLERTDLATRKTRELVTFLAGVFGTTRADVIVNLSAFAQVAETSKYLDDQFLLALDEHADVTDDEARALVRAVTKMSSPRLRVQLSRAAQRLKRPRRRQAK